MRYIIDIDGTICTHCDDYANAQPLVKRISGFNKLYDCGHELIYFTARGTGTGIDWTNITLKQFKDWGVKYTELLFGKPFGDMYIDDKAINASLLDDLGDDN